MIDIQIDFTCGECGRSGANVFMTAHALKGNPWYHSACLRKIVKCGHCKKELPMSEMIVSYWHAFEWRCRECEDGGK